MSNILLTCIGRRNYLAQYFKASLKGQGIVVGADMDATAPAFSDCDKRYLVHEVNSEGYIDQLLEICRIEDINLVVSLNDLELPVLAHEREKFSNAGIMLVVSNAHVIRRCFDKYETFRWLRRQGFNTPDTYIEMQAAKAAIDEGKLLFPLLVKPRWGSASIGIHIVNNLSELDAAFLLINSEIQRSILTAAKSTDQSHFILIQQMALGTEFGCDILNDFSGTPRMVVTKEKLAMRAGETDKSVLRNVPGLSSLCMKLGELNGHIGNLDCDIFVDGDYYQVLELNPRFGGGYPFSHIGGSDFPSAIVAWSQGETTDPSTAILEYDQPYSKFDTLRKVGINF